MCLYSSRKHLTCVLVMHACMLSLSWACLISIHSQAGKQDLLGVQKEVDRLKSLIKSLESDLEKTQALVTADKQDLQERITGLHKVLAYLQIQSSAKGAFEIDPETQKLLDSLLPALRDGLPLGEITVDSQTQCMQKALESDALQVISYISLKLPALCNHVSSRVISMHVCATVVDIMLI